MKRITAIVLAIVLLLLLSTSVLAASLSISPPKVEFEVPANGSTEMTFIAYEFTGDITIDCENIPLKVEPATVSVTAKEGGDKIALTFYGDESLGSKIYEGKIRFLATTGGMVAMGIKVKARVTNLVAGQTPVLATLEESQPPAPTPTASTPPASTPPAPTPSAPKPSAPAPKPPAPEEGPSGVQVVGPEQSAPTPPPTPGKTEWPILPIVGIGAGTIIVVTLIIVLVRRRRD